MNSGKGSAPGAHAASSPPSTTSCVPFTYEPRSDARKTAARATSSGCARRRSGMRVCVGAPLRVDVDPLGRSGLDELDRALGERRPGRDGVDADPVRAELERHRLRQPPERMLRGAVVREPGAARMDGVDRRDVDDRAAVALRPHLRCGGLDAEERAADVDADDAVELRRRHVLEQEVREDAGVVDEHVEPAEARHGRLDEPVDVVLDRDVALDQRRAATVGDEPAECAFEPVGAAVGEHDGGSRLGQPARAREAESLGCAGDERDLSAQVEQCGRAAYSVESAPRRQRYKIITANEIGAPQARPWQHC